MSWGIVMTRNSKADQAMSDEMLDDFFGAARRAAPLADADLMARIMDDARTVQAEAAAESAEGLQAQRRSLSALTQLLSAVGGWGGAGGLAAASVFGLWMGMSPTLGLAEYAQGLYGASELSGQSDLSADYTYLAELGELE